MFSILLFSNFIFDNVTICQIYILSNLSIFFITSFI
nr:MAG TPA: hypothetical protein [Caudoviricetes sp.]